MRILATEDTANLGELFQLAYEQNATIGISPPPLTEWHVVVNGNDFSSKSLTIAVQQAIEYLEAEAEHETEKIRDLPYS
jgi:hypothetical protein